MIEYRLIRSDRRTLSIQVDGEGALVVRAPLLTPLWEIEAFLHKKRDWIVTRQAAVKATPAVSIAEGARMPFWGGELRVHVCRVPMGMRYHDCLLLPDQGNVLAHARLWRKETAQSLLCPRVEEWAGQTGLHPVRVCFGNAESRWGSMSSGGVMRLNTALVHLPPQLCDYVIVHELVHLRYMNHSAAFHGLVRSILPDAEQRRRALRQWSTATRLLHEDR